METKKRATKKNPTSTKQLLETVTKILEGKKGKDISVINIGKKSILCDYFVIVSATSRTHSQALEDGLHYQLKKLEIYPKSIQGLREASWIIMDYGSIVIHIFTDDKREFYDLEGLWGE